MSSSTMSQLFGVASFVAVGGALALLAVVLRGDRDGALVRQVRAGALPLAWIVATAATLGSLYYSEVVGFEPCRLCWYQRIAMYPLVVLLGVATFRGDLTVRRHALPLPAIGLLISAFHVLVQRVPSLSDAGSCSTTAPCSAIYVEVFGFVSIPVMAGAGFFAVLVLLAIADTRDGSTTSTTTTSEEDES